jgi:alkylhydroperoxidase family enzyme
VSLRASARSDSDLFQEQVENIASPKTRRRKAAAAFGLTLFLASTSTPNFQEGRNPQQLRNDASDREAIITLAADGLDCGRAETMFGGKHFDEATDSLDSGIIAITICNLAVPDHVVADDERAHPGEL